MSTLREHLRAQVALFNQNDLRAHERAYQMAEHAVAALAILDAADALGPGSIFTGTIEHITHRLVPDPEPPS